MPPNDDAPTPSRDLYCLCAAWCNTCAAFKPVLDGLQVEGVQVHWVDIEDHDDALEDIDIVTFPTLVVADAAGGILFAGPVEPRLPVLVRLLEGLPPKGQTQGANEIWARVVRKLKG